MKISLQGKTAIVTGAARLRGLGHAFSTGLADAGANIVIADTRDATESAAKITAVTGSKALAVKCNVTDANDIQRLKDVTDRTFGGCDILVHAASPLLSHNIEDMDFNEWRLMLSVNLDGLYLLARTFLPTMKERKWGRIVCISSTTYHAGIGGRTHYVAAKAGMIGFARSLAREVGDHGVTVNVLAPGLVATEGGDESQVDDAQFGPGGSYAIIRDQQCIRKTLQPQNLVGPLVFLASDASAFVTGQTLLVDGGWQHVG